ncbi:hypothetical protein [Labilibaculum filiforme]|uniref:hypothetical protein n=1 Tax=Labilibaculum filiforme TaxID=1940526 RepID=UPI0015D64A17|nr:hypothetical protein [Labilibaculum filiforme]
MSKTIRSIQPQKEKKRRFHPEKSKREIPNYKLRDGIVEMDPNEKYYLKDNL